MDILDLSLGEKRSRRKTQAPQRRHAVNQHPQVANMKRENDEVSESNVTSGESPLEKTEMVELSYEPNLQLGEQKPFLKESVYRSKLAKSDPDELMVSPYSSPSVPEDVEKSEQDTDSSHAPRLLESASDNSNPLVNHALSDFQRNSNTNNNNNNNNNNHAMFNRFPQLPSNIGGGSSANPNPDLSAFQERLAGLTSSLPHSMMRPAMKPVTPLSYSTFDVQPIDTPGIPERTKKQNRWAFNVWREWARKRNTSAGPTSGNLGTVPMDVGKATEIELDYWLAKFVQEIRRKDGNPYPPHTLMQIVMGIQRYLRQQAGRPSICILDRSNPVYGRFRSVLDSRIKELTSEGVTASHKTSRRSAISGSSGNSASHSANHNSYSSSTANYPEQAVLWNAGVIGDDTALSLLNAVFYHNTVTFRIRNIDDHWNLKMSHFVLGNRGQQSQAYIEFLPSRDPLYVNRGMAKDCRVYSEPGNPRCVVKLFQKYTSLVPTEGPFYRHPQEPTLVDRSIRFSDQWVGKNRLRAMIKHVFDSTRLDGRERGSSTAAAGGASASNAPRFNSLQQNTSNNETSLVTPTVYDRLAQVMMQLSYLRSSPQMSALSNSHSSPANPSTPSPNPESTGYETPPPARHPNPIIAGRNEIVLKRESSPDSPVDAGSPKRRKTSFEVESDVASPNRVKEEADDVTVTSSCEKHIDENQLEIAVPSNIEAIIVVKGTKRITIKLE